MGNEVKAVIFTWDYPSLNWGVYETLSGEVIDAGQHYFAGYTRMGAIQELRDELRERWVVDTCRVDRKHVKTPYDYR